MHEKPGFLSFRKQSELDNYFSSIEIRIDKLHEVMIFHLQRNIEGFLKVICSIAQCFNNIDHVGVRTSGLQNFGCLFFEIHVEQFKTNVG